MSEAGGRYQDDVAAASAAPGAGISPEDQAAADGMVAALRAGQRAALARAITWIESTAAAHQGRAAALLAACSSSAKNARRIGITGVPGVGKSTFLEGLGLELTARGQRVAVLAVDPTSTRSGGSILGDKTRMARLAASPAAFIRPTASGGTLGGVHRRTREAMTLCEEAGYDVVLVETVGVGQSETAVSEMVDTFVLLHLPGAGDELQGIKRGVLELADVVVVHKADGDRVQAARLAAHELRAALRLQGGREGWEVPVVLASSLPDASDGGAREARDGRDAGPAGPGAVWQAVEAHDAWLDAHGRRAKLRADQRLRWLWRVVDDALLDRAHGRVRGGEWLASLEDGVRAGRIPVRLAAAKIVAAATA